MTATPCLVPQPSKLRPPFPAGLVGPPESPASSQSPRHTTQPLSLAEICQVYTADTTLTHCGP